MLTAPSLLNAYNIRQARERCRRYRRRILDISQQVTALHVAPAFSCAEITDAIYHGLMRQDADGAYRDVFLMSKGHGCMIQYVILDHAAVALRHQEYVAICAVCILAHEPVVDCVSDFSA